MPALNICSRCLKTSDVCACRRRRRPDSAELNRRKAAKQQRAGRRSKNWLAVTQKAKKRAGWTCQMGCGRHKDELKENERLTCHLDPAKQGDHFTATVDDVTVGCSTCHGGRSRGGRGEIR